MIKNNILVVNPDTEGLATLFILLPREYLYYNLDKIKQLSLRDIKKIRDYNINYAKYILELAIKSEISFTFTSSRSYTLPGTNLKLGVLKAYPTSIFLDINEVKRIVDEILISIKKYDQENLKLNFMEKSLISDDMVYRKENLQ